MSDAGATTGKSQVGSNLPDFRAVQLEFAAHIRHPELYPKPADVDDRRMRVYRDLVYNNIQSLLAGVFPIAKKLLTQSGGAATQGATANQTSAWHLLVREFLHRHPSTSPYFLEVSQEFLEFLGQTQRPQLPPFFLELCHYEWVELALQVAEQDIPSEIARGSRLVPIGADADLLQGCPVVSPLAKSLAYDYAVHRVRGEVDVASVQPKPTFLVVYRDPQDEVKFLEINAMTTLLLELLDGVRTGQQALAELATRLSAPKLEAKVLAEGGQTLKGLRERSIILGALPASQQA